MRLVRQNKIIFLSGIVIGCTYMYIILLRSNVDSVKHGTQDIVACQGNLTAKIGLRKQDIQAVNVTLEPKFASTPDEVNINDYREKLTEYASVDKLIILALVDSSFLDMAMNFYETSIIKFGLKNYLFVASDKQACDVLITRGANCYVYMINKHAKETTIYRSYNFNQKMNIRTYMILDALRLGFSVLHTDVDIVFAKDPLKDILPVDNATHMAVLWDMHVYNAGFLYIKSTNLTIAIYTNMKHKALTTKLDDQSALNKAITEVTRQTPGLKNPVKRLSMEKYQCGRKYFENGGRYFTGKPCHQCIVIHNNWIVTKEAKRYRFQETGLWTYDDEGYYSNITARYITYTNPHIMSTSTIEVAALKAALYIGHVLSRHVILPRFNSSFKKINDKEATNIHSIHDRPLNQWIKISLFDGQFYWQYRESTFLEHPKVPEKIKQDASGTAWISTNTSQALFGTPQDVTVLNPLNKTAATTAEIRSWFGAEKAAVLRLHSTYGIFGADAIPNDADDNFREKLKRGFKQADYRQF